MEPFAIPLWGWFAIAEAGGAVGAGSNANRP